jgi:endonuclease/exonuclease/phosphatase family metal-dependent hydrolase
MKTTLLVFIILIYCGCEPIANPIDEVQNCKYYSKITTYPPAEDTLLIMTWNIRFGCGGVEKWFGDACGNRTLFTRKEVLFNLDKIINQINLADPDILLIQEIDISSKKTAYIDEVDYILQRTKFTNAIFGTNWDVQFIPSDGLGKINDGKAIFSKWEITNHKLHPFPLRNDIDALTKYFYLRTNFIECTIEFPDKTQISVANVHLEAFSTDDTKKRQVDVVEKFMSENNVDSKFLILGGDFNLLPPNATKTDYCIEDMCEDENFHTNAGRLNHKDGSFYTPEISWLSPFFQYYKPSLPLEKYSNTDKYFTHTTNPLTSWDRTLDYLFSNKNWVENSHIVYNQSRTLSDHAAVSALWRLK